MGSRNITVDDLWALQRIGGLSLSPDGAQAVCSVTRYTMEDNQSHSALWLLSTLGGQPRLLTTAGDKDGQPQWSPRGDLIAFTAKREQEGHKDETPQIYLIAPDGGEARRAATVATGVEAFRWCADGRHIVFVSWVWPALKGSQAQAKAHTEFSKRKESGYATSEAQYRFWDHNLPAGRVAHLHLLDTQKGSVRDLFEGSSYELARGEPDSNTFDVSPDGRRVVFAFDPAEEKRIDGRFALAEIELKSRRVRVLAQNADWDFGAPRYSPAGVQPERVAFIASHQGKKHTMPPQLAWLEPGTGRWEVLSAGWDADVEAPVKWADDGSAVSVLAQQEGRRHLWRFDLAVRQAQQQVAGAWVESFDHAAGTLVTVSNAIDRPGQAFAHAADGSGTRRLESFNNALMKQLRMGRSEELWFAGAAADGKTADRVQMWLTYPPGFDGKKKTPLLHVIHGGPHTAFGDAWHYRWNVQVMAAQGYVVACVNYHGSSSFGWAFGDSITHRWGELELQDVEAATTVLLKKPWADKKSVFASGGSYGGYMVAWMNGKLAPGRYAAYVCHAGCYDWVGMFADDAYTWHAKELGAWYWDDMARVHSQSPHAFAKAMTTPTLVIHGALDYRVPDAQGLAYYNTLKAKGVPARLLWYPDENHWILKPRNSQQWYGEFFAWLARFGGAKPKGGAPAKRVKAGASV
jgi:dipeptidyl aminopeptidase/acylaminoacyl peptidase